MTHNKVQQWYTQILASQVCTFDQAMKLKALRVMQQSLFYFSQWTAGDIRGITIGMQCSEGLAFVMPESLECCTESSTFSLSAYTVAELMAMIGFRGTSNLYGREPNPEGKNWYRIGFNLDVLEAFTEHLTKPLTEALGDLLLFRIERNQITIEEANERLAQLHANDERIEVDKD